MLKYLKIFVLIIFQISLIQPSAFGLNKDDCQNSSFYIKNINVDFTKKSIIEARYKAEKEARNLRTSLNKCVNDVVDFLNRHRS